MIQILFVYVSWMDFRLWCLNDWKTIFKMCNIITYNSNNNKVYALQSVYFLEKTCFIF